MGWGGGVLLQSFEVASFLFRHHILSQTLITGRVLRWLEKHRLSRSALGSLAAFAKLLRVRAANRRNRGPAGNQSCHWGSAARQRRCCCCCCCNRTLLMDDDTAQLKAAQLPALVFHPRRFARRKPLISQAELQNVPHAATWHPFMFPPCTYAKNLNHSAFSFMFLNE